MYIICGYLRSTRRCTVLQEDRIFETKNQYRIRRAFDISAEKELSHGLNSCTGTAEGKPRKLFSCRRNNHSSLLCNVYHFYVLSRKWLRGMCRGVHLISIVYFVNISVRPLLCFRSGFKNILIKNNETTKNQEKSITLEFHVVIGN